MEWHDIGWFLLGEVLSVTTLLAIVSGLISKNVLTTLIFGLVVNVIAAVATYVHLNKHYPHQPELICAAVAVRVLMLAIITALAYHIKVRLRKKPVTAK